MPKTRAAAFDSFQSASEFAFHSTATRATTGMHSFRSSCGQARDASGTLLLPDNQAARARPSGAKSLSGRTRTGVSSVSVSRTPPQAAQANECTMTAHEARCSNFDMYHFISILQLAQVGGSRPASESLRRSTIAPSFSIVARPVPVQRVILASFRSDQLNSSFPSRHSIKGNQTPEGGSCSLDWQPGTKKPRFRGALVDWNVSSSINSARRLARQSGSSSGQGSYRCRRPS